MKSSCCGKEMVGFTADTYPFESGYECSCCGNNWSDLQISKEEHLRPSEPWRPCTCGARERWLTGRTKKELWGALFLLGYSLVKLTEKYLPNKHFKEGFYRVRYYKNQMYREELWDGHYITEFKTRREAEAFIKEKGGRVNYD